MNINDAHANRPDDVLDRFLDIAWLESGLSRNTLTAYRSDLTLFQRWLLVRHCSLELATRTDVMEYLSERSAQAHSRSRARLLCSLRRFYRWALRENLIDKDPTQDVASPNIGRHLPSVLSEKEVDALLHAPDVKTPLGLRDRAMLEVMYASGLRVSELVQLRHRELSSGQRIVRIFGKGHRERIVPLGEEAMVWLERYLKEVYMDLQKKSGNFQASDYVFLTRRGVHMTRQSFWLIIKRYSVRAGLKRLPSPHTLRHAFATHLLNHGAGLRTVQMLLGHRELTTTQIYTHIAHQRLHELHQKHHPRG